MSDKFKLNPRGKVVSRVMQYTEGDSVTPTEITASGAIAPSASHVALNNAGAAIAATIAAPAAGRRLTIVQTDAGTQGHTVTLTSGTYDGTTTIATFNAQHEALVLEGVSVDRFIIVENVGAVALS
jgi:hypothetical protein